MAGFHFKHLFMNTSTWEIFNSRKYSKQQLILILLGISFFLNTCSKESFPRITKIKIEKNAKAPCRVYLQIVDLSDGAHKSCGVQYSRNNTFGLDSTTLPFQNFKKGDTLCLSFPSLTCGEFYYLKPYCYNNGQILYGPIDTISFSNSITQPTILSLDTSLDNKIIVKYYLPLYSISISEIRLCRNINSSNDVMFSDSFNLLSNIPGNNSVTITPIQKNVTYKFKIFVKVCGQFSTYSTTASIKTPISKVPCNGNVFYDSLEMQQKSTTKVMLKGKLKSTSTPLDFGVYLNSAQFKSCSTQSLNNFNLIHDVLTPGPFNAQLYYQCNGGSRIILPIIKSINILIPKIEINEPIFNPSNNTISVAGTFNILNYPSSDYGICYSKSNTIPTLANSSHMQLGSNITLTLAGTLQATSNSAYYLRYYVKDCDSIIYSAVKSCSTFPNCSLLKSTIKEYSSKLATKNAAAFLINGNLYVGGGIYNNSTTKFYMYNSNQQRWDIMSDILINEGPNYGIAGYFVIENKGYVLERNYNTFLMYNASNNTWIRKPSLSTKRQDCSSVASSTKGYIIGGQDQNGNTIQEIWEYDPSRDMWKQITYLNEIGRRVNSCAFIIGDFIYLFGGNSSNNDFWKYSISNTNWSKVGYSLPTALYNYEAGNVFVHNGFAYVIKQKDNKLFEFDPKNGWRQCTNLDISPTRQYGFSAYDNNNAFIGLGLNIMDKEINDVIMFR